MSLKRHFSDSEEVHNSNVKPKRNLRYYFQLDQEQKESPPKKLAQNVKIPPPLVTRPPIPKIPPIPPIARPAQRSENEKTASSHTIPRSKPPSGIAIKLGAKSDGGSSQAPQRPKVAAVFNADDSSDEEEMPMEAKMRMRNMGRDTITSSGPNSFGKTKRGFTDTNKLFERQLKEAMDEVSNDHK